MTDAHLVTQVALWLSGACFVVYLVEVGFALFSKPVTDVRQAAKAAALAANKAAVPALPTIDDLTKLTDAVARLTDSLSKAGPSLTSLIAAVLFLAIAAISGGALRSAPPTPQPMKHTAGEHQPT